jgi:hypothetical protein
VVSLRSPLHSPAFLATQAPAVRGSAAFAVGCIRLLWHDGGMAHIEAPRRVISPDEQFHGYPDVQAWSRTVAPGTIARAADLLPSFLATAEPGTAPRGPCLAPWTPVSLGMALTRISGRVVDGRLVVRARGRNGVHLYHFEAWPRPAQRRRVYPAP